MGDFFEPNTSTTTQNTSVQPWMQAAPYLTSMYGQATDLYQKGLPQTWTGSVNAPLSSQTQQAQGMVQNLANQGTPQLNNALNSVGGIAQGQGMGGGNAFLQNLLYGQGGSPAQNYAQGLQGSFNTNPALSMLTQSAMGGQGPNPYLQQMSNAANQTTTNQYMNTIMPGIESIFSQGGRYGGHEGGALAQQQNTAAMQLGSSVTHAP